MTEEAVQTFIDNPIINMVTSARYEDESYSTIHCEWYDKFGDRKLRTYSIPADPENSDYQDLMKVGWSPETLAKATEAYKRQASKNLNIAIRQAAESIAEEAIEARVAAKMEIWDKKLADLDEQHETVKGEFKKADKRILEADLKMKTATIAVDNAFWNSLLAANENKDDIFKFKLWALELDKVKESSSDDKKELRKQTTLLDCMTVLNSIINK